MSTVNFHYNSEAIEKAKQVSRQVTYEGMQRKLVEEVSEVLSKNVGIKPLALKGFMLRAAKQWQLENNQEIRSLAEKSPSERINAVREIIENLRVMLQRILSDPSQVEELNGALKDSFKIYLSKYAGRQ